MRTKEMESRGEKRQIKTWEVEKREREKRRDKGREKRKRGEEEEGGD